MNIWLIGAVAVVYTFIAINYFIQDQPGAGIIWGGYALANIGFIWLDLTRLQ